MRVVGLGEREGEGVWWLAMALRLGQDREKHLCDRPRQFPTAPVLGSFLVVFDLL